MENQDQFSELLELSNKSNALLTECRDLLKAIEAKAGPAGGGNVYLHDQYRSVVNTLGHTQAQIHMMHNALKRMAGEK